MLTATPDRRTAPIPSSVVHATAPGALTKIVEFTVNVLGAEVASWCHDGDGRLQRVTMQFGNDLLTLESGDGGTLELKINVPDIERTFKRAITGGAIPVVRPSTASTGERYAAVRDHSGTRWWLYTPADCHGPARDLRIIRVHVID